jgi:hypothetical protein
MSAPENPQPFVSRRAAARQRYVEHDHHGGKRNYPTLSSE